jgi:hypothetical protein
VELNTKIETMFDSSTAAPHSFILIRLNPIASRQVQG